MNRPVTSCLYCGGPLIPDPMIAHWRFCVTCDPKRAEMNERMSRFQRFEQGRLLAQDPRGRPHIGGIRK